MGVVLIAVATGVFPEVLTQLRTFNVKEFRLSGLCLKQSPLLVNEAGLLELQLRALPLKRT